MSSVFLNLLRKFYFMRTAVRRMLKNPGVAPPGFFAKIFPSLCPFPLWYGIIQVLLLPFWQRKGGADMQILFSLLIAVTANVLSYFICKWLDGDDRSN